jgi:L-rhamnose mutarotase
MRKYCLALDLKNDEGLIAQYEVYHQKVWPEILQSIQSIKGSGIETMEIFRVNTRLFMIMEVNETFSFEAKKKADEANPKVQEWEDLMWKFQEALPFARPGEKWVLMNKIFDLKT